MDRTCVHQDNIMNGWQFEISMYLLTAGTRNKTISTALVIK